MITDHKESTFKARLVDWGPRQKIELLVNGEPIASVRDEGLGQLLGLELRGIYGERKRISDSRGRSCIRRLSS